jgi:hypothetical protein
MAGNKRGISLDVWATLVALAAAIFVRIGLLKNIPW